MVVRAVTARWTAAAAATTHPAGAGDLRSVAEADGSPTRHDEDVRNNGNNGATATAAAAATAATVNPAAPPLERERPRPPPIP